MSVTIALVCKCVAVLPQKVTTVRCPECGAVFGVQRPPGKKPPQEATPPLDNSTYGYL